MITVIQVLVVGILLGLVYTLVGVGMSLSLGVLRVLNLTHGMAVFGGSMLAYQLFNVLRIPPLISALIAIPVFFGIGALLEVLLVRRAHAVSPESVLLVLFGAMILLQSLSSLAWTDDTRSISTSYSNSALRLGGVVIRADYAVAGAAALIMIAVLYSIIRFSMAGRAVQALAQHPDAARIIGINVSRYSTLVFAVSTAAAGVAGVLVSLILPFSVQSQTQWLAFAFIVVLVGGTGGVLNAVVGGLALGLSQAVFNQLLPLVWVPIVVYGLLVAALIIRGGGLAAAKERTI